MSSINDPRWTDILDVYTYDMCTKIALEMGSRLRPDLPLDELLRMKDATYKEVAQATPMTLVINHDCLCTGCGDVTCGLCMYNPSRKCTRNFKMKYTVKDPLLAKCGASIKVRLHDSAGNLVLRGMPEDTHLAVDILDGATGDTKVERHWVFERTAPLQDRMRGGGSAWLDGFEASAEGTFRLMFYAADDATGKAVDSVQRVISDAFTVTREKAMERPFVENPVYTLMHITRKEVPLMADLKSYARKAGCSLFDLPVKEVKTVGDFRKIAELARSDEEFGVRLRKALRMPEKKYEELVEHALMSMVPDNRLRMLRLAGDPFGIVCRCLGGVVQLDEPVVGIKVGDAPVMGVASWIIHPDMMMCARAVQAHAEKTWFQVGHPGWSAIPDKIKGDEEMPYGVYPKQ
jgi:hypothetical protein